jgi:hypothetical protein
MILTEEDERIILGLCDEAIQELELAEQFDESMLEEGILIYKKKESEDGDKKRQVY